MLDLLWLVPLLPFLGAALNGLLGPRVRRKALVTAVGVGAPGALARSWPWALWAVRELWPQRRSSRSLYAWTAGALAIDVAFLLDPLSAVMLFVVTFVGF